MQPCPYKIGDIVKANYSSYCKILKLQDENGLFLVQYVKSKHGVPIRKGRIFLANEKYFEKTEWDVDNRKYKVIGWNEIINKENENV